MNTEEKMVVSTISGFKVEKCMNSRVNELAHCVYFAYHKETRRGNCSGVIEKPL